MGSEIRDVGNWSRSRKLVVTALVVVTLGVGILIGTVINGRVGAARGQGDNGATLLAVPSPVQLSSTFATIADKLEPAVVNISTIEQVDRRRAAPRQRTQQPQQNDPFRDFFDRFFDGQEQPQRSLGSGVIVDKKGYILTNNHVVENASKIQVKLHGDSTKYNAKLIGADEETDLAVIKIEVPKDLPVARLGNSESVRVGDWVLAIGSPWDLEATVTAGIISAKDRGNLREDVRVNRQFKRYIQTDAAINPGNSGGPLVNMAGEVIGINTAIYSMSRGFDGVGFAMPSNTAISVYNQLIKSGKVTRGSIGVSFNEEQSTNPILLSELGAPYGVYLQEVRPGSPAEKAGLRAGDVVTAINGQPVKSGSDLVTPIVATPIGEKVKVAYVRDKKNSEAMVTVEDRTKLFPETVSKNAEEPEDETSAELGLRVAELTPDLARRLGIERPAGVIVAQVDPGSFAEDLGFIPRDILIEVNRQPVNSVAEYRRAVSGLKPGQTVIFKVLRSGGGDRWLSVPLAGKVPDIQ